MDLFIKFQNKGPTLKFEKGGFRINGKNYFFNTVGDKLMELIIPTMLFIKNINRSRQKSVFE